MKKVVIIMCFSAFVILLINSRFLIGFIEYFSHFGKANEKYISRTYNVDVTSKKQHGNTIVFYGKDNDTNKDVFIFCVYGHGIHQVYEDEGINREKALQVFKQYGNDATLDEIGISVWSSFFYVKGENINNYLYYFIEREDKPVHSKKVGFINGAYYINNY